MNEKEHHKPINTVFIGHVDVGKSTICGRILLDSEKISKHEMNKLDMIAKSNKKESWNLAYIMDTDERERQSGKTSEFGYNEIIYNNQKINIIDAPGHKYHISNMIQALQLADIPILVVSAKTGEFESGFEKNGQTKEHILIAKGFGLNKMIILINKMDDKTVNWSEKIFNDIKNKIKTYLLKYKYMEEDLTFIPISGINGDNIRKLNENIRYNKITLLDKIKQESDNIKYNINDKLELLIFNNTNVNNNIFIDAKITNGILNKNKINNTLYDQDNRKYDIIDINNDNNGIEYMNDIITLKIKNNINNEEIYRGLKLSDNNKSFIYKNEINCKMIFFNNNNNFKIPIISTGYKFNIHYNLNVYESEIININGGFNFIKLNNKPQIYEIKIKLNNIILSNNNEFIMKVEDTLLGMGKFTDK
jgi:peptide chain release factor subunit 3